MGSKKTAIFAATLVLAACGASAGIAGADPHNPGPPPGPAPTTHNAGPPPGPAPATHNAGSPPGPGPKTDNPAPPPAPTPKADNPAPPPAPGPKTAIDHDGTFAVGTEIAPGTYSTAGPVGKGACYWKRLGGANGKDIVDNAMTKKPQVVQIDPSDKAFKTDGCQPWQKTDTPAPASPSPSDAQKQLQTLIGGLNGAVGQSGAGQAPGH
ncbi:hypothetical protein MNVI_03980 [Mycobacterium noviomagense]|uniref:Lipoprotein n=1 Tax=Mycobacterium noviomagense TaxID=459858 RepID=A0A7I7P926_9MYCO|nr:hypothetical protein MNVI_03980 [Mycobacterium noviomagense]